ncbi:polysaccharide biosynthesis C-terminal domain-containing protein, partial [Arthrospira platensis SPKY2]
VAFYSLAVKLMTMLSMVIVAINVNMSPIIALLFSTKQMKELQKTLKKAALFIFAINLTIGAIIILFGKFVLSFFGPQYSVSYTPLIVLVIGQVFSSLFGNVAVYLNMTNKQSVFKTMLLLAVFINLILNTLLIPNYEMLGAAI